MIAHLPAVLLLLWSGIAATTLAGLVAAPLLRLPFAAIALAPRQPTTGRALWLGLGAYPLAYGVAFTIVGEATIGSGALAGLAHAALLGLLALRHGGWRLAAASTRRMGLCGLYGAVLGFAFVMP
ncbi:MAG: hypothetical protein FIB01_13655 [Gemmatimonadetes bacterium]|nr:hypothetical protein [Gemmatimonadota bacterium]